MSAPSRKAESSRPTVRRGSDSWQEQTLSTVAEMVPLIDGLLADMAAAGFQERDRFGMHLVLEEAIVNAVKHGNRNDPSKCVQVRWQFGPDRVVVEIEDQGPGFNIAAVPDPTADENLDRPCGRGLMLIRAYTTSVDYNDRGNRLTVCKVRTPARAGKA